jgi:hypothetical protein
MIGSHQLWMIRLHPVQQAFVQVCRKLGHRPGNRSNAVVDGSSSLSPEQVELIYRLLVGANREAEGFDDAKVLRAALWNLEAGRLQCGA